MKPSPKRLPDGQCTRRFPPWPRGASQAADLGLYQWPRRGDSQIVSKLSRPIGGPVSIAVRGHQTCRRAPGLAQAGEFGHDAVAVAAVRRLHELDLLAVLGASGPLEQERG